MQIGHILFQILPEARLESTSPKRVPACVAGVLPSVMPPIIVQLYSLFQGLSSEGVWYTHRTRAYHLEYIEKYCIIVRSGHPSSLITPAIIVDFRPGTAGAARLHSGLPDHEAIFRAVMPPHIESRFNELFGEMKQAMTGTLPDGKLVRFVEGIYPWVNGGFLSLLVKMKAPYLVPAKDMEFSVVSSVARIFYPNIQE